VEGKNVSRHLDELSNETRFRERLEELELSRATWEAEIEAAMVKVESRYKAASSSEQRERSLRRKNAGSDDGDFASEEDILASYRSLGWVPQADGDRGEPDEMSALPADMANARQAPKSKALAAKFGG